MPTARPRFSVTETDDLATALREASSRWPELVGDKPAAVRRLLELGIEQLRLDVNERAAHRRESLRRASDLATGLFPARAIDDLHDEWPA